MNISVRIPKEQIRELIRKFQGFNDSFDTHIRPIFFEESERLTARIQELTPVGVSAALRRSISYRITGKGFSIKSTVTSASPYAPAIEFGVGSKKVFPPYHENSSLELWTKRKLGKRGRTIRSSTYFIARSIFEYGIDAIGMFKKAFEENKDRIESRIKRVVEDSLSKF